MSSTIGRETAAAAADAGCKFETSPEVTLPRGMKQARCAQEQCLKVIDTASLRSSSGSRSNAFAQDESMSQLVASISALGIIEPIVVRQVEADAFVVVAGERRLMAARLLNLRQVPCVVTQCSDSEALLISLTENLQRSDLDPIEKACALRRLLSEFGLTQQEVGKRVGMCQSTIAHHLRLLALPAQVQRLISEGALSVGHGKVLAGMDDEQEAIEAALDCIANNKSVREFEAWLSGARSKADRRSSRESLKNKREERELRNGLFLVIKESRENAGSGTIEIPYYSPKEKDWVLKALSEQGTKQKTSYGTSPAASQRTVQKSAQKSFQGAAGTYATARARSWGTAADSQSTHGAVG